MVGLLCLLVLAVLMVPGFGYARLEYPLALLISAVALFGGRLGRIRHVAPELALLYAMMISGAVSIFAYYSSHTGFHWRDLMSVLRLPVYGLVLTGALYLPMEPRLRRVFAVLVVCIGIIAPLISVVQYFDIGGVNAVFLKLYRTHVATYVDQFVLGTGERRVIGTAGNPNLWGFLLGCYAIFLFSRIVVAKKNALFPVLLALIVSIAMTGSRSALLAFLIGAISILIASSRFARGRAAPRAALAFVTLALPVLAVVIAQSLGSERFDTRNVGSMYQRFRVWRETLVEYQDDLLLGRGPTKSARTRVQLRSQTNASAYSTRDNNYIAAVAETGLVGLSLLLALFATMWLRLWHLAARVPPAELHWVLAGFGVVTAWIAFSAAADAFNSVYLAHNVWVLYGVVLSIAYSSIRAEQRAESARSPAPQPSYWGSETGPAAAAFAAGAARSGGSRSETLSDP